MLQNSPTTSNTIPGGRNAIIEHLRGTGKASKVNENDIAELLEGRDKKMDLLREG